MTVDRQRQVEELYRAALERPAADRATFIASHSLGDDELRRGVEAMLAKQSATEMRPSPIGIPIGTMIGTFRIDSVLAEGGMGVVCAATDTTLNRRVAVKFLSEDLLDASARRRFQREAQMASALNHPHILTVYAAGEHDGRQYLVTEYVDGGTLHDWMSRRAVHGWRQSVELLIGIADALATAHAANILHRDVKPANILVSQSGYAKLADFGLAKSAAGTARGPKESETTGAGVVLGTIAYMSPEQAAGRDLDARSDIFSFGIVLYELLAGHRPFSGATDLELLQQVIHGEPASLPGTIPEPLRAIVEKAIEKEPGERYQTMRDFVVDLRRVARRSGEHAPTRTGEAVAAAEPSSVSAEAPVEIDKSATRHRGKHRRLVAGVFALTAILASGAVWWVGGFAGSPRRSEVVRLKLATFTQLTDQPGAELYPNLAPDGKSFVYASRASGNWDIYFQRVGGKNPVNLTKDSLADDTQPVFSPDGEQIVFRSERGGGGIFVMGATGENVKRITDFGYNPAWGPDGSEIVCATTTFVVPDQRFSFHSQLFFVSVSTGEKRSITPAEEFAMQPHWSPHGHRVTYWSVHGAQWDIWTIARGGGEPVPVTNDAALDWNPVWSPDGTYLYFASDRGGSTNLWRVPIDEKSGRVSGELEPVTTPSSYSAYISFSHDGRSMSYAQRSLTVNLNRVAFDASREQTVGGFVPVTQGSRIMTSPDLSPDGEWLAASTQGSNREDLFVVRSDGTGLRQLTDDTFRNRGQTWSPDGKRIAFYSNRSGKFEIWMIRTDGSGLQRLTEVADGYVIYPSWSPDGSRLAYGIQNQGAFTLEVDKPWSSQTPQPLAPLNVLDTWFATSRWSPDGGKLAGFQARTDGFFTGISIYSFDTREYARVTDFGWYPRWLSDGRRLLFHNVVDGKVYIVDSLSRKVHEVLSASPNEVGPIFAVSADDRWIYFSQHVVESDIWLAKLE